MRAGKMKLAFIEERSKRKAMFTEIKKNLKKQMEELTTECGIDACAIIHCEEFEPQPTYWPSRPEVERVVGKFRNLPPEEQTENGETLVAFLEKKIKKVEEALEKKMLEDRQKKVSMMMFDSLAGRLNLENCAVEDREDVIKMADLKLIKIQERIALLKGNFAAHGAGPSRAS